MTSNEGHYYATVYLGKADSPLPVALRSYCEVFDIKDTKLIKKQLEDMLKKHKFITSDNMVNQEKIDQMARKRKELVAELQAIALA